MTDNHDYALPEAGATDWNVPLNENFTRIDREMEVRDVAENRSNYRPYEGALFRATDTGTVYLGDGSDWHRHNPPTEESSTGTPTLDGVRYVRPGEDLQRALEALPSGGGMLVLGAGRYTLEQPLRRDIDNVTICGVGHRSTELTRSGDFNLIELREGEDRRRRWLFRDLDLDGAGEGADLVHADHADLHRFDNVRFSNCAGNGVNFRECWDWKFSGCEFCQIGRDDGTACVYAYNDTDNTNNMHFVNCRWEPVSQHALYSDTGGSGNDNSKFHITNCKFHGVDDFTTDDLIAGSWSLLNLVGNWFARPYYQAINLTGGHGNAIAHNTFQGETTHAEAFINNDARETSIIGNVGWTGDAANGIVSSGDRCTIIGNKFTNDIVNTGWACSLIGNVTQDGSVRDEGSNTGVAGNVNA